MSDRSARLPSAIRCRALLQSYRFPRVVVACVRCKRRGEYQIKGLREGFPDQTMGEVAVRIAAEGGCLSARTPNGFCSAYPSEPSVEHWATLMDAYQGRWRLLLHCQRNMEAFKASKPCAGPVEISIVMLKANVYWATPLERLRGEASLSQLRERDVRAAVDRS